MRTSIAFVSVATAASLCACATPGERTAIGAGGGAVAGAGVGALLGGWKGAAIGAGAGALAGGAVGNYLDKQKQELEKVAQTKRTRDGLIVELKNSLLFDTGSAILKPEAVDQVSKLGDILAKYPDDRVRIEGHTDNTGRPSINEELSKRRADAVREVLVSRGVKESQMLVLGLGETRPLVANDTPAHRAENRRVELHIDVPQNG